MNHVLTPATRKRRLQSAFGSIVLATLATGGCGPGSDWDLSYNAALGKAQAKNTDLVVFYKNHLDASSGQMEDLLTKPPISRLLAGKVECLLVPEFEPNRRFVAQYGVDDVPAIIIIHPDETYHAVQGPQTLEALEKFITEAVPPGEKPDLNPSVPREYEYRWFNIYEDALEEAKRQNRQLLVVYKWWLSGDSSELIRRMMKPEVARHFATMIHCMLDWDYVPNRQHMAQFGVDKVPALVIVHQDGTFHAMEGLASISKIVEFAVAARAPGRTPGQPRTDRASGYSWHTDFDRALGIARRRNVNVFVFYHSVFSDTSKYMESRLAEPAVAALFRNTVNCKLDWSNPRNRDLMEPYGVDRVPAFLIIRPDGTFHTRIGPQTAEDLESLVQAAQRPGRSPVGRATSP